MEKKEYGRKKKKKMAGLGGYCVSRLRPCTLRSRKAKAMVPVVRTIQITESILDIALAIFYDNQQNEGQRS